MAVDSRRDEMLAGIAVFVLLVGTATGNASVMLGMSEAAVVLMAVFCRRKIQSGQLLVAFVAAVTAAAIGIVMAMR